MPLIVLWLLLHLSLNWCSLQILPLDSKTSSKSVCTISDGQLKSSCLFCQQTIFVQLCLLLHDTQFVLILLPSVFVFIFSCPVLICSFTFCKTSVHVAKVCNFVGTEWPMLFVLLSPLSPP